ncbi:Uncharacterized protein BM_BM18172 [Brugia malayi]|uniref:Uncharacterized protein n=1 Tax=Brugia malayi TaxID=6279 RepID=A0A4E9FEK9_BRUMA|nr:Uncharacterized protein BM_BM18172 [Brugia malayi]VIO91871.1 Uncharacterized protein BM_BM18172 [Brugia malayi]
MGLRGIIRIYAHGERSETKFLRTKDHNRPFAWSMAKYPGEI